MKRIALVVGLLLSTGACASGASTSSDGCKSGQVEVDGACITLCVEDTECPAGYYCVDGKCAVGNRPAAAVVAMTPVPGSLDVGVMPLITLTFSVPMDLVSLTQSVHLLAAGETEVGGNVSLDDTLMVMTFTLGSNLAFGTDYTVRVDAGARSTGEARVLTRWERVFSTTDTPDLSLPDILINSVASVIAQPALDTLDSFTFNGTAADADTPIEQVQVQIVPAGTPVGTEWAAATVVNIGNSATWSYRWFPKMVDPLPDGTYTLHARAYDKGGNPKLAVPMSFEADVEPPLPPTFVSEPKTPWKFKHQALNVQSEINSTVEVRLNDTPIAGSPFAVGTDGVEAISVTYPTVGSYTLAIFAVDANGNRNDTPVTRVIQRTAYTCLVAANGFPLPAAAVVAGTLVDDENGQVSITYELSSGVADDASIQENNATTTMPGISIGQTCCSWAPVRALVSFSNDLLPACATITSARLRLVQNCCGSWTGTPQMEARPLLKPWTEASVTWNNSSAGTPWGAAGASGAADVGSSIGGLAYEAGGSYGYGVQDLTMTARAWAGGTANHGILLSPAGSPTTTYSFGATEDTAASRPRLELELVEPE